MTQTLQNLVSKILPAWVFSDATSAGKPQPHSRLTPAPNTEAEAAAWLMRQERRNQRAN